MSFVIGKDETGRKYEKQIRKLWASRAKWRRKNAWYKLNHAISKERSAFDDNRLFSTYTCLDSDSRTLWLDFTLPSKKSKDQIYNCFMTTCQYDMHEKIDQQLFNEIFEESKNDPDDTINWERDPNNFKMYTMKQNEVKLDRFDGRTRFEEHEHRLQNWYNNQRENGGTYKCIPHCKFEYDYVYGIGTHISIDEPYINLDVVNKWVEYFYSINEVEYSLDPVPQDHLIYDRDWMNSLNAHFANPICIPDDQDDSNSLTRYKKVL